MTNPRSRTMLRRAGVQVDALREAEKKIERYERAFRRILRACANEKYPRLDIQSEIERVYPPRRRKR